MRSGLCWLRTMDGTQSILGEHVPVIRAPLLGYTAHNNAVSLEDGTLGKAMERVCCGHEYICTIATTGGACDCKWRFNQHWGCGQKLNAEDLEEHQRKCRAGSGAK